MGDQVFRRFQQKAFTGPIRRNANDLGNAIDVAGHDVTAKLVACLQRPVTQSDSVVFASVSFETSMENSDPVASGLIEVAVSQTPLQQIDNPASSGRRTWAVHITNLPADLDVTSPTSVINPVNIA